MFLSVQFPSFILVRVTALNSIYLYFSLFPLPTMVDNSQEYRLKYWAPCSSVRLFARTAHSFACSGLLASLAPSAALTHSLTSLTPSLVGK